MPSRARRAARVDVDTPRLSSASPTAPSAFAGRNLKTFTTQVCAASVFGAPRDINDPRTFHNVSLIALLAWVGLGADGLSSSAYGPDEALPGPRRPALPRPGAGARHGGHGVHHLARLQPDHRALPLRRRRLRRRHAGCSGRAPASSRARALLVDYVLTISVSIAAGADAIFSFLPPALGALEARRRGGGHRAARRAQPARREGVGHASWRRSSSLFLVTHAILIVGGVGSHLGEAPGDRRASSCTQGRDAARHAWAGRRSLALFLRAYSMGGGTYTGIEAVSNGLPDHARAAGRRPASGPWSTWPSRSRSPPAASCSPTCSSRVAPRRRQDDERGPRSRASPATGALGGLPVGHWFVIVTLAVRGARCSSSPRRPASSTARASWPTWRSTPGCRTASPRSPTG